MRFHFSVDTEQPSEGGSRLVAGFDLQELVTAVVRRELNDKTSAGAPSGNRSPDQRDLVSVTQWLAPFLQQTIIEAFRLGLSLRAASPAAGASSPTAGAPIAPQDSIPPTATASEPAEAPPDVPEAAEQPVDWNEAEPAAPSVLAASVAGNGSSGEVAPWLVSGQLTLVASPFAGFAQVQQFLADLGRVPRIYDARPKRFTGGRLYITLSTEYTDTKALADVLQTELSPYRPSLRSVQGDLVELVLKPPAG